MNTENSGVRESWAGPRSLDGNSQAAAFPLGGIGAGNVSIGARGELRDWEISNHPDKNTWLPFTFFAIRARAENSAPVSRVLESRIGAPHEGDSGYPIGRVAGLPRLQSSTMRGEYPLLSIEFEDDKLPVDVRLDAFTPLIPLDVNASSLPAGVLRYTVSNPLPSFVDVTIAGSMSNPLGITGHDLFHFPTWEGLASVELRTDGSCSGLEFTTDLDPQHLLYGSAVLATRDTSTTAIPQWPVDHWEDGVQLFWDDFTDDGLLKVSEAFTFEDEPDIMKLPRLRVGSLGIVHRLAPGEVRTFEFVLAWHVPNRSRAWNGNVGLPNTHGDEVVLNHYATRHEDAWAVATYLLSDLERLEGGTRAFHDSLFDSTLPHEVTDAISATLVAARSTTCLLLDDGSEDGRFAGWEGSFDHAGSCEGTCTHVWNYAQSVAFLFPSLERSARRIEFLDETLPDGRMRFRTNSVFGNQPFEFHPAVDGQLGTIVRLYREWRFSGDDEFLAELWPAAQRALEFAFTTWDSNGDWVLDSQQHNTYDIEFYGENSLANSMFFAALLAGAAMADHLGDPMTADRYRTAARVGAQRMDALLFNGDYYDQRIEDVDAHRYQYGAGCLSDQMIGQTFAHLNRLGYLFPESHVKSAVSAIFRHNFRTDFTEYQSVQRTYALGDERGLVLCTWPTGGRPRIPFVYSDEVWTGIEYQVATHLIYEGFVEDALEVVRGVRSRHDGVARNPWNEAECGNHYARSMASWGLLIALTGANWDGPAGRLELRPAEHARRNGDFRSFFSTARGWGTVSATSGGAEIRLHSGTLALNEAVVDLGNGETFGVSGELTLRAGDVLPLSRVPMTRGASADLKE